MQQRMSEQRLRGRFLYPAPQKLSRLIEIVNLVPPTRQIPDLDGRLEDQSGEGTLDELERGEQLWLEGLKDFIESLPEEKRQTLREYLFNIEDWRRSGAPFFFYFTVERYKLLREAQKTLHALARLRKNKRSDGKTLRLFPPLTVPAEIRIDKHGNITLTGQLIEALSEKQIDVDRIRECAVCRRIFWAGRIDAQQCGATKCKNTLGVRLWRERKDIYNRERRKKASRKRSKDQQS